MKGYKTLAWACFVAVAGVLIQFDWASIIPSQYQGWALMVIGAVTAALRYVTTTPLGKSE